MIALRQPANAIDAEIATVGVVWLNLPYESPAFFEASRRDNRPFEK
jgi:hypothetical protein